MEAVQIVDFDALYQAWEEHCKQAGHKLAHLHPDGAQYDRNLAGTYIECCAKGCKWNKSASKRMKF